MDQKELSNALERAINEVISNFENYEQGDFAVDWAVVAYVANASNEDRGVFFTLYSNGSMPDYKARGLYAEGIVMLDRNRFLELFEGDE